MSPLHEGGADSASFSLRLIAVAVAVILCFGVLGWRLYTLQVVEYDDFAHQAENNRTAVIPIVPDRGEIVDRNGAVLATNERAYSLEVTPARVPGKLDDTLDALNTIIPITPRDRRRFARLRGDARGYESVPLKTRLTDEEVARFAAQQYRFPGVHIAQRLYRTYPYGAAASHVVGYIGRINEREKEHIEDTDQVANYRGTDTIGKRGLEAEYEKLLHGTTGVEQLETRASGHAVRRLDRRPSIAGETIKVSLDIRLQQMVEALYGDRRGALVAIDPRNGQILALVSMPTFDPNLFVDGLDQETWDSLNDSPDHPLLDRALRGTYPPGSTYKPFMGLAGLQLGARTPDTKILDNGSWMFGGHTFRSGHALGIVDLKHALEHSSNVYFYTLANDLGVEAIHDFMKPLGFGQITGVDLPGELRGVLPSKEWKARTYKKPAQQRWYRGETISLGIGQGYNSFTMLQLASALATLVDGGVRHTPHLLEAKEQAGQSRFEPVPEPPGQNLGYEQKNIAAVLQGMQLVPVSGTSRAAFAGARYRSGGKTGTAQVFSLGANQRYNAKKLSHRQLDHALYIGYAPAEDPTIAVAAIVEHGGFGAGAAAPIVRRVLDYWVSGIMPNAEDIAAVRAGRGGAPIGPPIPVTPPDDHQKAASTP